MASDQPKVENKLTIEDLNGLVKHLDIRVENQEVLIHSLLSAYMELWAMMNVTVQKFLENKSEEEETVFMKHFQETRTNVWNEIGKIATHDFSGMDTETAAVVKEYIKTQQNP